MPIPDSPSCVAKRVFSVQNDAQHLALDFIRLDHLKADTRDSNEAFMICACLQDGLHVSVCCWTRHTA